MDQTRSTRNQQVNYKETANKTSKAATQPIKTKSIKASATKRSSPASATKRSAAAVIKPPSASRLSSTSRNSIIPAAQNVSSGDRVRNLELRLESLETSFNRLNTENSDLRQTIDKLQLDITQLKDQAVQLCSSITSSENCLSLDQQELNTNIVIRGVDVKVDTPEPELLAVYEGIRTHLGISNITELTPVSVKVLTSNPSNGNTSSRPIQVQLPSVAAKRHFLQVRRIKKDIFPSDIGITQTCRRPVLISEQLTRRNQELLFQARSLREKNNFKFIWSNNGQILARHKPNSKVIRITDVAHINCLRTELNLEPLAENGRLRTTTSI